MKLGIASDKDHVAAGRAKRCTTVVLVLVDYRTADFRATDRHKYAPRR